MSLGKLEKVDLRAVWKNEAIDFTNWLAEEDNLTELSDEIGIEIKLVRTEAKVGSFSVDILAEEEGTERKIIIENQLEQTNHDHLGKVITYASGYDAEIIIWIVSDVREEHKRAIDWLNEHTDDEINFFAIKMELWKIGESPFAPKFHIVSQPNDWAKAVKQSVSKSELTETKLLQDEFYQKFKEYGINQGSNLRFRKPSPKHWYTFGIGHTGKHISVTLNSRDEQMGCELYIRDSKETYNELFEQKDKIENELDEKLEWMELPLKKASRIKISHEADINNKDQWEDYFKWLLNNVEKFSEVFSKYL